MKQRDLMYRLYRRLSGAGFSNSHLLHQDIIASQGSWALLPSAHAQQEDVHVGMNLAE